MNRFLVMLLVLSLICLKATTSTAVAAEDEAKADNAEAAPAKGKADEKKTTGKKAGADAAGEKKDAPSYDQLEKLARVSVAQRYLDRRCAEVRLRQQCRARHNAVVVGQPTTAQWIVDYGVSGLLQHFFEA